LEALGETRRALVQAGELRIGIIFTILNGCINYSRRFYAEVLADPHTARPMLFHLAALLGSTEINYTVIGDQANFLPAIELGCHWLRDGRVDGVLIVSAEEMDWLSGEVAVLYDPKLKVGEGGAAVYLERETNSQPSAVKVTGNVISQHFTSGQSHQQAAQTLCQVLPTSELICTGLTDSARTDAHELAALADGSGRRLSPLERTGSGIGVSSGWQVVAAVAAIQQGLAQSVAVVAIGNVLAANGLRLERGSIGTA
jgi:hypothetical protein